MLFTLASVMPTDSVRAEEAEPAEVEEIERWVPALAFEVGVYGHTGKGNVSGTTIVGPRNTDPDPTRFINGDFQGDAVVPESASREEIISALLGLDFEIMSPRLLEGAGDPRLFVNLSVDLTQTSDTPLAREGSPGTMVTDPDAQGGRIGEAGVFGRGSEVSVQHKDPQVRAGLGVAFTKHFDIATIRIKPSILYSRVPLKVTTATRRAFTLDREPFDTSSWEVEDPNDYRLLILDDKANEVYHGTGAALEIEYDTGERIGPFEISLYLKGEGVRFWGGMETELTGTNPEYPEEQVFWKYTQDRWTYRGMTGFRLRYVPGGQKRR